VGVTLGSRDGPSEGSRDGPSEGCKDGPFEGCKDGRTSEDTTVGKGINNADLKLLEGC